MSHEADFYGDRLRLHAFLRVVDDGFPKRPTRLRHRLLAVGTGYEFTRHDEPEHAGSAVDSAVEKAAYQGLSDDVSTLGVVRSLTSEQNLPAPEEPSLSAAGRSIQPKDDEQARCVQLTYGQLVEKRTSAKSVRTATKAPNKLRKATNTRKRRRLSVNELALVRSTSSDGLPRPSDADKVVAAPVAAGDPIEDSQVVSCVSLGTPRKLLAFQQVQKFHTQSPIKTVIASSLKRSGLTLRGQLGVPSSVQRNGPHHQKLSTCSFSIGSDGFIGAELSVQRTRRLNKARNNNKAGRKKPASASAGLVLAPGHLPTPPVEHHVQALPVTHRMSSHTQARIHDMQPLSERALTIDGKSTSIE